MDAKLQLVPDPRNAPPHDDEDYASALPFVVLPRGERRRRLRPHLATRSPQRAEKVPGRLAQLAQDDRGAVTAEYAIVIMAAVAFAGLLVAILRSAEIRAMLVQLVEDALGAAG